MRDHRSSRGFRAGAAVGVLIGLLIGSAGVAAATFWVQGWQRFSDDFKVGYINGFLDMANLARNLQPGGWVDTKYPQVPQAKPVEWANVVNELYKDPANARYSITSILQTAAQRLEAKYGRAETPEQRTLQRMQHQLEMMRKKREKAGLPVEPPKAASTPTKVPGAVKTSETTAEKKEAKKPARKWCRCDGKDPKAARAARKAAAAKKEAEEAAKGNAAAAAKTPPAADKPAGDKEPAPKPAEQRPAAR
jgi:hypothetical protein